MGFAEKLVMDGWFPKQYGDWERAINGEQWHLVQMIYKSIDRFTGRVDFKLNDRSVP